MTHEFPIPAQTKISECVDKIIAFTTRTINDELESMPDVVENNDIFVNCVICNILANVILIKVDDMKFEIARKYASGMLLAVKEIVTQEIIKRYLDESAQSTSE